MGVPFSLAKFLHHMFISGFDNPIIPKVNISRVTSVGRSERIRMVHLLEAIWKVKLITPLTLRRASSHKPRWSWIRIAHGYYEFPCWPNNHKQSLTYECACVIVSVSLLTVLSSPWMCRVTDLAFLLEVFIKNWDFFLCCLSGVRGKGLAGAFRILNTSWAKAVMSTDSPSLHGDMLYLNVAWSQHHPIIYKITWHFSLIIWMY